MDALGKEDAVTKKLFLIVAMTMVINIGAVFAADKVPVIENSSDESQDDGALETYNRAMFSFNNGFNHYVLMPASRAYRAVTTVFIRKRVHGILTNLRDPLAVGNYLLQGNFKDSGIVFYRFLINSTLGLLGMFDVAEGWGYTVKPTDFDDTFAKWCIKDGPYIILPFFGSSTPRAAVGMGFGFALDPVYWATRADANYRDKISLSYAGMQAISIMEANMDLLNDLEKSSVDFYATMKSAYLQNRGNKGCFNDENASSAASYDFNFEEEEEEENAFKQSSTHNLSNLKPALLVTPINMNNNVSKRPELLVSPK